MPPPEGDWGTAVAAGEPTSALVGRISREVAEACHVRPVLDGGPAVIRIQDGVQGGAECREVALVDAAVLQLASQLQEEWSPVTTSWSHRRRDLHQALDHLDG
jgi:hypothetical protein